jgi:hypothetical protein
MCLAICFISLFFNYTTAPTLVLLNLSISISSPASSNIYFVPKLLRRFKYFNFISRQLSNSCHTNVQNMQIYCYLYDY